MISNELHADTITTDYILRRQVANGAQEGLSGEHQVGKLTIDFAQYKAHNSEGNVKMSYKEFEILQYLLEHKNVQANHQRRKIHRLEFVRIHDH